jgi:hypothetical protein
LQRCAMQFILRKHRVKPEAQKHVTTLTSILSRGASSSSHRISKVVCGVLVALPSAASLSKIFIIRTSSGYCQYHSCLQSASSLPAFTRMFSPFFPSGYNLCSGTMSSSSTVLASQTPKAYTQGISSYGLGWPPYRENDVPPTSRSNA